MKIDQYEFFNTRGETCIFGLNITKNFKRHYFNIFNLKENEDLAPLAENLWGIRHYLSHTIFPGMDLQLIDWTATNSFFTSDIEFYEVNGHPARLVANQEWALAHHQQFDLAKYADVYSVSSGKPMHQSEWDPKERKTPEINIDVYAVPCLKAKDGVFYCRPHYYQSDMHDNYFYFMADTQKLVQRLEEDDPSMINEHAPYKFKGEKAEDYLESNSLMSCYKTGSFIYSREIAKKNNSGNEWCFTFQTGDAGMLILMQELGLPFIPVSVPLRVSLNQEYSDGMREIIGASGNLDDDQILSLVNDIGYLAHDSNAPGQKPQLS
jgi:hypothetical protein